MEYTVTVGLEVHAELKTKTKVFCNSKNDSNEVRPNVNICPICMGHPGVLPILNREAILLILRVGAAVSGTFANYTEFDRKNYFYPDIPKGYQISQYAYPLIAGGELADVAITRIHLEEDTARSSHDKKGDQSLIDFNRAGVPLMELVTEPVIHSAEEAGRFARELQLLLQYLGVSNAHMEKGEMRVEANISISKDSQLGTKVEVKNLNSFRAVERAIDFEIKRHSDLLDRGEKIIQETRGWDESKQQTFAQRRKEESHDYRYFPDPDVPKLILSEDSEFNEEVIRQQLPELPWERRAKLKDVFKLKKEDYEMYTRDRLLGDYFEKVAGILGSDGQAIALAANYISSDLANLYSDSQIKISPDHFSRVIQMVTHGELSSRGAKNLLKLLTTNEGDPRAIAETHNLLQRSNEEEMKKIISEIIADHPDVVRDYKSGKEATLQFLIGQGMQRTKGAANPTVLKKLFRNELAT